MYARAFLCTGSKFRDAVWVLCRGRLEALGIKSTFEDAEGNASPHGPQSSAGAPSTAQLPLRQLLSMRILSIRAVLSVPDGTAG